MMRFFQRGAMFGLDARITLLIACIIGIAVGVNELGQIKSKRIEETYNRMGRLKEAWIKAYVASGTAPADIYTDLAGNDVYGQPIIIDDSVLYDAWNSSLATLVSAQCNSEVPYRNVVIISPGPDGVFDVDYVSSYDGDCDSYMVFESMIQGDDLYTRFTTYDMDKLRFEKSKQQLVEIGQKLEALADHNRLRWQRTCEATGTGTAGCDYDSNGTYVKGEEAKMNFYPYHSVAQGGCGVGRPFYADNASFSRSYTSNNLTSMQNMMTMLGLPTSYARDPWLNILKYNPNTNNSCNAPFAVTVWYQ